MAVPDDNHSSIDRPHLFARIYTTHAAKVIQEYIAADQKDNIRRVKIELDIIRMTNDDPNLPLRYKVSCTSMILHTDTFEPFWGDQKLAYSLSAKSLKRLKPNYRLVDKLPCRTDAEDATALSPLEQPTDMNGKSRHNSKAAGTTATNKGKRGPRAAAAKTNGKTNNKKPTTAAANRKKATVAQKAPRTSKPSTGSDKPTVNGVNGANCATGPTTAQPAAPRRAITAREAYDACMAIEDGLHLRGPTSDEEETTTDDDSDSD